MGSKTKEMVVNIKKEKQYICHEPGCNKVYKKMSHLKAHITWHSGERPFVCDWESCGKRFTRSDELRRHMRTHTGEKRFQCTECSKKFMRSDHLSKHFKTHKNSRKDQKHKKRKVIHKSSKQDKYKLEPDDNVEVHEETVFVLKDENTVEQTSVMQLDSSCVNQEQFVWISSDQTTQVQAGNTLYTIQELNYPQDMTQSSSSEASNDSSEARIKTEEIDLD